MTRSESVSEKNVGGKARTRVLTLAEIEEIQLLAYQKGVDNALDQARKAHQIASGCGHHFLECENAELRVQLARAENRDRRSGRR